MLMITSFTNPRVAQAFVDYMATQGVILTIQQHTQTDVWLADESQAGRVKAELARFLENPATRAIWRPAGSPARPAAGCTTALSLFATFASARAVYAAADGGLHHRLLSCKRGGRPERDDCPGLALRSVAEFDVWRYFSHALMHFSVMHILFNLLWWWYLGGA
jgi:GlpG protein